MVSQILNLAYVMPALTIVIGIANTLALSTYERTRELGLDVLHAIAAE